MGVVLTQTNRGTSVYEVCPEFMFPQYLLSRVGVKVYPQKMGFYI